MQIFFQVWGRPGKARADAGEGGEEENERRKDLKKD